MTVELTEIESLIKKKIAEELEIEVSEVDTEARFQNMGLDSISSMFMINELEDNYDVHLKPMNLMDYPTVSTFSKFVHSLIHEN